MKGFSIHVPDQQKASKLADHEEVGIGPDLYDEEEKERDKRNRMAMRGKGGFTAIYH